ncbi:MAG: DUF2752 domain-containing protein [Myxococcaceae bacterium]
MTLTWAPAERRFGFLHALGLAGLLGLLAARFLPLQRLPFWRCALREHTGWPCPGCGLSRVAVRVAHGDIAGALDANPLGTVAALGFAACAVLAALQLLFALPLPLVSLSAREARATRLAVFSALAINYAVVVVRVRFLGWP